MQGKHDRHGKNAKGTEKSSDQIFPGKNRSSDLWTHNRNNSFIILRTIPGSKCFVLSLILL